MMRTLCGCARARVRLPGWPTARRTKNRRADVAPTRQNHRHHHCHHCLHHWQQPCLWHVSQSIPGCPGICGRGASRSKGGRRPHHRHYTGTAARPCECACELARYLTMQLRTGSAGTGTAVRPCACECASANRLPSLLHTGSAGTGSAAHLCVRGCAPSSCMLLLPRTGSAGTGTVRPLARVSADMLLQVACLSCRKRTVRTLVRPLARVRANVRL